MAQKLTLPAEKIDQEPVHILPCTIAYQGPAKVSSYFLQETDPAGVPTVSFRGRTLKGKEIELPEGMLAVVLPGEGPAPRGPGAASPSDSPSGSPGAEGAGVAAPAAVRRFTYWNHDTVPSGMDPLPRALEWVPLARGVHAPVPISEVDAALARLQASRAAKA